MKIIVAGASNQIGYFLLPRLSQAGHQVIALSRQQHQDEYVDIEWVQLDLHAATPLVPETDAWVHAGPLHLLPSILRKLPEGRCPQRVIAFSSTSRLSKVDSQDSAETLIAQQLASAEAELRAICDERDIAWTVFRPTLIYGCGRDANVTFIANFIKRFGFFPLVGKGQGLRQPVHADDLAIACTQALDRVKTYGQTYALSGGQTLSYRAMVRMIFQALGHRSRTLPVPLFLFNVALQIVRLLPRYRQLSPAMLTRMNQDLCFPHETATLDFDYQPRTFQPVFEASGIDFGVDILEPIDEQHRRDHAKD
ncbi:MAG: NAD-dependent epimerase/dehydratase family protein [Pseudomonadota bacterium]